MSQRNNLVVALLFATNAANAADLTLAQVAPSIPKTTTIQVAPTAIVAPPVVTAIQPAGSCINKGTSITVQGRNFGAPSGKSVALGGQGIHVDLPVSSWSGTSISATLPNDARIQAGKPYYIGVEKADHSQWLSNIDRSITVCASPTTGTLSPQRITTLSAPPIGAAPTGGRTTPGGGTSPDITPEAGYADPTPMPTPMPMAPIGGGSVLNQQLPPPPKNAPPAPARESAAVEPSELVVVSSNMNEAQQLAAQAQALRLSVKRRTNLGGLGFVVTVFRVPKEAGVGDALLALRQAQPNVWADANHRFQLLGDEARNYGQKLIGWNVSTSCGAGTRIGLVDTALDATHPMLRGRQIQTRDFLTTGNTTSGAEHGTATAALLVGNNIGMVPGAQLFAANIFRVRDKETDTTAEWVVLALNWLAENRVGVINLSLGGPRNLLVEAAVQRLLDTGVAVVAAAGNGGENAPPVFPAAQQGVIAVTAIDANAQPYKRANRGDYIAFAAPGVDVWTASPGRDGVFVSGTSYAAPFVSAALAAARATTKSAWPTVVKQLQTRARDLGDSGKDNTFGWGLIQSSGCAARKS